MKKTALSLILIAALLFLSSSVLAVDRLVPSSDYPNIQSAIDAAVDGDTIIVAQGTYHENINFKGKNIILTSTNPTDKDVVENTIIDGNNVNSVVTFAGTEISSCLLTGFTITNGRAPKGGGIYGNGTHATIRNNVISDNGGIGYGIPGSYGWGGGLLDCDGLIENNLITRNSAGWGGGLCDCDGTIQNNVISYNGWYSGIIADCDGLIRNNLVVGNRAIYTVALSDCGGTITNCTIVGNKSYYSTLDYCKGSINNCIIWGNMPGSFDDCNIPSYSCIENWSGGGISNINTDPCFVDPCSSDYHLLETSPCINVGDPNYVPEPNETDLDGKPRIIGNRIDMGAYEFNPNHIPLANAGPDQTVYADPNNKAIVTLDGSASFDDDNDPLTYLWTWTIDSNSYDADGVNPIIELPVGKHTISLVVNDGIEDSEPNEVVITVVPPLKSRLEVMPNVINRSSNQPRIMALVYLPAGVTKKQVDNSAPILLYPGGIKAVRKSLMQYNIRGVPHTIISASFDKDELMSAVGNGRVKLRVVGKLKTGQYFYGDDSVVVMGHRRR